MFLFSGNKYSNNRLNSGLLSSKSLKEPLKTMYFLLSSDNFTKSPSCSNIPANCDFISSPFSINFVFILISFVFSPPIFNLLFVLSSYLLLNLFIVVDNQDKIKDGFSGTASSRVHQFYQSFEFSYVQRLMNCAVLNDAGLCFYVKPGLEYTRLNFVQQNTYNFGDEADITTKDKSKVWGVGPSIALAMDYNIFKLPISKNGTHALAVNASFAGAVLSSDTKSSTAVSEAINSSFRLGDKIQKTWRLIPAFHARAGLNYLLRGEMYAFNLGVGYEFNSYNRAVARQRIVPLGGTSVLEYTNYDLQGLVVTGSFGF